MKQAILIQCHRNPAQVSLLLDDPNLDLYVHADELLRSDKWLARKFADEAVIGRLAERIRERPREERRFPAGTRESYESDEMSV